MDDWKRMDAEWARGLSLVAQEERRMQPLMGILETIGRVAGSGECEYSMTLDNQDLDETLKSLGYKIKRNSHRHEMCIFLGNLCGGCSSVG